MLRAVSRITPTLLSSRVNTFSQRLYSTTMANKVIHAKTGAEYDAALKGAGSKLAIVDFSAEWCGPCKAIAPKFNDFSNKYDAVFIHVDIDEINDHPHVQTVTGVPHFKFFKNGEKITEFSGANASQLANTIQANL